MIPQGFDAAFPELLARSKVFLSGFGQSFYEALAVGAHPVAWPLSAAHRADARAFYRATGLPDTLISDPDAVAGEIAPLLATPSRRLAPVEDGTPAIIQRLAELREAWS